MKKKEDALKEYYQERERGKKISDDDSNIRFSIVTRRQVCCFISFPLF